MYIINLSRNKRSIDLLGEFSHGSGSTDDSPLRKESFFFERYPRLAGVVPFLQDLHVLSLENFFYIFKIPFARLSSLRKFKMEFVFFKYQFIVAKVCTKKCPEAVDFFSVEFMPEVRVELLFSIEKIEYIEKKVFFISAFSS